jgi:hypothetical protein
VLRTPQVLSGAPRSVNLYLLPHEQSVVTVRQHPAALITSVGATLAGLAAAAIYSAMHSRGSSELVLTAVWIAWGLLVVRAAFRIGRWFVDYFVITSVRILVVTGLGLRTVAMLPLMRVNDVSVRRSFFGRVLGYGELVVQHGRREQSPQRFQYIPYCEQLYLEISDLLAFTTGYRCPTCDGRGTVFRRDEGPASPQPSPADYRPAGVTGSDVKKLLKRGYLEVVCPSCGGRQKVPGATDLEAPSAE